MNYFAIPGLLVKDKSFEGIVNAVCEYYKIPLSSVLDKTRDAPVVKARHISMFLLRRFTPMTLKQIAQRLNRDHSTVMAASERIIGF